MGSHVPLSQPHAGLTIFDVLAARARSRSDRFLGAQAAATFALAAGIRPTAPSWWPLASLLLAVSTYSIWGLVDGADRSASARHVRLAKRLLVVLATVASLVGVLGIGIAAFAGDAPGPYGMCHGRDGRAVSCDARGNPR
ncbi:MAG: hypothetical protein ACR2OG_14900 [Gemmatimonadaceae bacterium]